MVAARVRLVHVVELSVKGKSEEAISDFLACNTPNDVKKLTNGNVEESFNEEVITYIRENSVVDYEIP